MRNKNNYFIDVFIGFLTTLITLASVVGILLMIIDRKRKKEDKELEEYLEKSIN